MQSLILPLLLFCSSLTVMAGATIAPSLPGLKDHFAATPEVDLLVRLVLTIPGLAIALAAPLAGGLSDRIGRKPVLLAGIVLYALSGASGLVLDSLAAILVGRVLLGFAVGMVMTSATALIIDLYAGPAREKALGQQAAFMGFGGVVFLIGGGLLAEMSWRGPFSVYLAPLAILPLLWLALPRPQPQPAAPPGAEGMDWRTAGAVYAFAFVGMIVFYIIPVQLPFLLRGLGAPSPALAGMGIAACSLASALTSLMLMGRVRARLGLKGTLVLAYGAVVLGYGVIAFAGGVPIVFAGLLVAGFGFGLQMPSLVSWLQSTVPPQMRGRAAGFYTMAVFLGQFVSPFIHAPAARAVGYSFSYLAAAGLALALTMAMAAVALRRGAASSP
jgi:MFS family permease